jgi:hypothetical protein
MIRGKDQISVMTALGFMEDFQICITSQTKTTHLEEVGLEDLEAVLVDLEEIKCMGTISIRELD